MRRTPLTTTPRRQPCVCVCVCVMCWCSGCEAGWLRMREQVRGAGRAAKQRAVKRRRTSFSAAQLLQLDDAFRLSRYLVGPERRRLAASLQLTETQVHLLQYRYTTSSASSSSSSSAGSVATAQRNTGTQSSRGKYARYPETGLQYWVLVLVLGLCLSTIFKYLYWYWYLELKYWYLYLYLRHGYWYLRLKYW